MESYMTIFKVRVPRSKRPVIVHADYYRIEEGVITFRVAACNAGNGGYPGFVRCFAHDAWLDVANGGKVGSGED